MNDDTSPAPETGNETNQTPSAPTNQTGEHEVVVSADGQLSVPDNHAPVQPVTVAAESTPPVTPPNDPVNTTDNKPSEVVTPPIEPVAAPVAAIGVPITQSNVVTPESDPAPVIKGTDNVPATPMIFSHNSLHGGIGKSHRMLWTGLVGLILCALIVGGYVYFWMLPANNAKAYLSAVKPAYDQQVQKMNNVYDTLLSPIFTKGSNTTEESDAKDLANIKTQVSTALNSTNSLKNKNTLKVLPGTTWQHDISEANKKHEAMQKYLSDCNAFLKDYDALSSYIQQLESILTGQFQTAFESLGQIGTAKTPAEISTRVQATLALTSPLLDSMKKLNPPPDLKQYNDNIVNNLTAINKALSDINAAIAARSQVKLTQAANDLDKQLAILDTIDNSNIDLQKNSNLNNQITILKTEKPLN